MIHRYMWQHLFTSQELLTESNPYANMNQEGAVILAIKDHRIPVKPSTGGELLDQLWPLCLQCWVFWPNDRPSMGSTLRTLRRLTIDDATVNLDLHVSEATHFVSTIGGQMDAMTRAWQARVQVANQAAISLAMVVFLCVTDSMSRGLAEWPQAFMGPWLAGVLTWYWVQSSYFTAETCERAFNMHWAATRHAATFYFSLLTTSTVLNVLFR
jgi:hypothetical protein